MLACQDKKTGEIYFRPDLVRPRLGDTDVTNEQWRRILMTAAIKDKADERFRLLWASRKYDIAMKELFLNADKEQYLELADKHEEVKTYFEDTAAAVAELRKSPRRLLELGPLVSDCLKTCEVLAASRAKTAIAVRAKLTKGNPLKTQDAEARTEGRIERLAAITPLLSEESAGLLRNAALMIAAAQADTRVPA